MSLFVNTVGSIQLVNYLGIAVSVPISWLKDGYLSMDKDGTIWVYSGMPTRKSDHWSYVSKEDPNMPVGHCVLRIGMYLDIKNNTASDHDFIAEDVWKHSVVKVSECPVISY